MSHSLSFMFRQWPLDQEASAPHPKKNSIWEEPVGPFLCGWVMFPLARSGTPAWWAAPSLSASSGSREDPSAQFPHSSVEARSLEPRPDSQTQIWRFASFSFCLPRTRVCGSG